MWREFRGAPCPVRQVLEDLAELVEPERRKAHGRSCGAAHMLTPVGRLLLLALSCVSNMLICVAEPSKCWMVSVSRMVGGVVLLLAG